MALRTQYKLKIYIKLYMLFIKLYFIVVILFSKYIQESLGVFFTKYNTTVCLEVMSEYLSPIFYQFHLVG
jgi:hypothetical protein